MSEQTGQFRSAAFGGFHRQDVLDYVEGLTKEKQDLDARLAEEKEGRSKAESLLAQAEEEAASLREAQETMAGELEYLRKELEARSEALSRAEEEVKILRGQVEALRPGAESWEHIKERAGNIEISAHERAQITIQDAHTQAEEIQAEGVRLVKEIQAGCDRLQVDLQNSIRAAEDQLESARSAFRRAEQDMDGYQDALARLLEGAAAQEEALLTTEETPESKE